MKGGKQHSIWILCRQLLFVWVTYALVGQPIVSAVRIESHGSYELADMDIDEDSEEENVEEDAKNDKKEYKFLNATKGIEVIQQVSLLFNDQNLGEGVNTEIHSPPPEHC